MFNTILVVVAALSLMFILSAAQSGTSLLVFYQGQNNDNAYYTNSTNGNFFDPNEIVPSTGVNQGVSVVSFNGSLFAFHQALIKGNALWYNELRNGQWIGDAPVAGATLYDWPNAAVYNDALYLFYISQDQNTLSYKVYKGPNGGWSSDTRSVTSTSGPYFYPMGVATVDTSVFSNRIFLAVTVSNNLYYTTYTSDGGWTTKVSVGTAGNAAPSPVQFGDAVYIFTTDANSPNSIAYYTITTSPSKLVTLNKAMSQLYSPTAVVFHQELYVFVTGLDSSLFYTQTSDGSSFTSPLTPVTGNAVGYSPSACTY